MQNPPPRLDVPSRGAARRLFFCAAAMLFSASAAVAQEAEEPTMQHSAGTRELSVTDAATGIAFPVLVTYPTELASRPISIGPFSMRASPDAPPSTGRFPLAVISHGSGGNHLAYLTIAQSLAEQGYMVAMPEHYGNNHRDNHLEGTSANLENRPRHVSLVIDALAGHAELGPYLKEEKVAVIGHSMGGYTALAIAGGTPWNGGESSTTPLERVRVTPDPRAKALVLLAPATIWFYPKDSLAGVTAPILLLTAEHDDWLSPGWHRLNAEVVRDRLSPTIPLDYRVIQGSGHFSFSSPFPDSMKGPGFPPSIDPAGFDRQAFHQELNRAIVAFLRNAL